MTWLLLSLVWLFSSFAFTLGWAAGMRPDRRYCPNCSGPGRQPSRALPDHVHIWTVIDGHRRAIP